MAGGSLLMLLDDIATLLDDVALLTKVAARKTAGVLGDDLALNAQQVAGVAAERELPVVWAVARGSLLNKAILVPSALAISAWVPWLVTPLMVVGGTFLCYEGVEKLAHRFLHREDAARRRALRLRALADASVDMVAFEKDKVRGAIRTDFILSAEIVVISLGVVAGEDFSRQVAVLSAIALAMTAGVYGAVAGIVKLDDAGLHLSRSPRAAVRAVGTGMLRAAPWLMKALSVAGTAAMFLVGGGILVHSIPQLHHAVEALAPAGPLHGAAAMLGNAVAGVLAGAVALLAVRGIGRLFRRAPAH
ncbi:DUF808 domain-containing protein [Coralloluteibacterium thermophilus]|uniref:DUF808 domain-containing protein n=1 Tax=Coralloluteibacterium thermophilum TaxID=2707049 RepID=A0ABV9NGF8_9GAMM